MGPPQLTCRWHKRFGAVDKSSYAPSIATLSDAAQRDGERKTGKRQTDSATHGLGE
jgi:hypothetical protein